MRWQESGCAFFDFFAGPHTPGVVGAVADD